LKTTILQPTYFPWLGYFEMIDACEQFVVFDHVQFESKSWQQRNRIRGPNGEIMLTVPVLSDGTQDVRICDKRIDNRQSWAKKHLRSIEVAYRKAPHFDEYYPGVRTILESGHERLADLTVELIRHFLDILGIRPRILRSSEIRLNDAGLGKTEKVIGLCRAVGATELYDGAAAKEFLDLAQFERLGIQTVFQAFVHPEYPQQGTGFLPYMGIVDLLMNSGPASISIIRKGAQST
jgi:hypothetical protein